MNRVLVIGSGGAGKSTFAKRLARATGLPLVHLDALFWKPGWVETPKAEWRDRVEQVASESQWIMDGNYGGTLDQRLAACDTVVFLDLPRLVCMARVLKRFLQYRGRSRPDMTPGCPEKMTLEFLLWIWQYPSTRRPGILVRLNAMWPLRRVVILRSAREVERFLVSVERGDSGVPSLQSPEGSMNGYNFTERVRKVLAMSREDAARRHHEYVGIEHMLTALLQEGEGVACAVLQNLGLDIDEAMHRIDERVKQGSGANVTGPDLPYTSRAKKVLELSMAEARDLNHSYVGTEHLLLGMLREERGIGAQVLSDSGITLDAARMEMRRLLGSEAPGPSQAEGASHRISDFLTAVPGAAAGGRKIASVSVALQYHDGSTVRGEFTSAQAALEFLMRQQ